MRFDISQLWVTDNPQECKDLDFYVYNNTVYNTVYSLDSLICVHVNLYKFLKRTTIWTLTGESIFQN